MEWVASTLPLPRNMVYPALLPLIRKPRLSVVDGTDAPADLNGLVRFAEERNLVSMRVPSHFNWPLTLHLYSASDFDHLEEQIHDFTALTNYVWCQGAKPSYLRLNLVYKSDWNHTNNLLQANWNADLWCTNYMDSGLWIITRPTYLPQCLSQNTSLLVTEALLIWGRKRTKCGTQMKHSVTRRLQFLCCHLFKRHSFNVQLIIQNNGTKEIIRI
jgi:hypothetical protein